MELFAQRGYPQTSVADICARGGVAKGTFFLHFATKDAVITELVQRQTQAARDARTQVVAAGRGPIEALRATVLSLGKQAGASRQLTRAMLAGELESTEIASSVAQLFEALLREMIADARAAVGSGLLRAGVDPERLAHALLTSYLGCVMRFCIDPKARRLTELLEVLVDTNLSAALAAHPAEVPDALPSGSRRRSRRA
jgi:TetR/AcrR family transcriptional repressor of nem operon